MPPDRVPLWFQLAVAALFLVLFAVSYLVDLHSERYETPAGMYPVVLAVLGFVYRGAVKGLGK